MDLHVAALGALPALGAMWYVDRLDARRPEPRRALWRVALAGALAVLPAAVVELVLLRTVGARLVDHVAIALFHAFVVAAAVEEVAKLVCCVAFVWKRPEFDERMDGIVYATRAGLGFALVENVLYLWGAQTVGGFAAMFVARAVLAVPGHAIWAGMMGYYAARRRFDGVGPGAVGGLAFAILLHGAYDGALFLAPVLHGRGHTALAVALLAVPIVVIAGGALVLRRMTRTALALDAAAEARARSVLELPPRAGAPGG